MPYVPPQPPHISMMNGNPTPMGRHHLLMAPSVSAHPVQHLHIMSGAGHVNITELFYTSTVAICVTDILTSRILDCNQLFASFFGFDRQQVVSNFCTFLQLTHPSSYDVSYQLIGNMLSNLASG